MIVPRFTIHRELLWGTKCFHTLCYFNFAIFIVDDISNIHVGSYARRKKMYSLKTGDGSSTSFEDEDDSPEDRSFLCGWFTTPLLFCPFNAIKSFMFSIPYSL